MKKYIFLSLLLAVTSSIFPQHVKIDSLKNLLQRVTSDTARARITLEISNTYMNVNTDSFYFFAQKAQHLARKVENQDIYAETFINFGSYHLITGDRKKALEYYFKALDVYEANDNKKGIGLVYWGLASVETEEGNLNRALDYYTKALETFREHNRKDHEASILNNMGIIYGQLHDPDNAIACYNEALEIHKATNSIQKAAIILINMGERYLSTENYCEAEKQYLQAIKFAKENDDYASLAYANFALSIIYHKRDHDKLTTQFAEEALINAKKISDNRLMISIYDFLSELHHSQKNLPLAYQYQSLARGLVDTVYNTEKIKQITEMQEKFKSEQGEKENQILHLNNQKQKVQLKYIILLAGLLASLLVFSSILFISKRKSHQTLTAKNKEIAHQKDRIEQSEKLYRTLIKTSPDGIVITDMEGRIIFASDFICRLLNIQPHQELGMGITTLIYKDEQERFKLYMEKIRNNEKMDIQDFKGLNYEKKSCYFSINAQIISNSEGKKEKILFILRNNTSTVIARQKLAKSETELKKALESKDKFISILAHDLKNPFHSLLGFIQLIIHDFEILDTPQKITYLNEINSSAGQLLNLVENLLEWSRMQNQHTEISPEVINLKELGQEIIELLTPQADNKKIKLVNDIAQETDVLADKNMISTVMRNLLSNSIKFTHNEGMVVLSSYTKNGFQHLMVEDNGIGMDETTLSNLFKIDRKVQRYGTKKETGTGLGLLICKEFIDHNKGEIWVESEPGGGSKFIFSLPHP